MPSALIVVEEGGHGGVGIGQGGVAADDLAELLDELIVILRLDVEEFWAGGLPRVHRRNGRSLLPVAAFVVRADRRKVGQRVCHLRVGGEHIGQAVFDSKNIIAVVGLVGLVEGVFP